MGARGIGLLLLAAGALAAWALVRLQRAVIFPGSAATLPIGELAREGGVSVWLEHAGGRSETWWLPARPGPAVGPSVVYAHGNGELIDHWLTEWEPLRSAGVSVLLVEYPGYGRSPGAASERSIGAAMRAAYDWLVRQPGVDPRSVVGYGRSLGGGAVCLLARDRALAALVLESTFTSVRDVARAFGLPGFLLADAFESLEVVRGFRGPLLILHGEHDEVIPVAHAETLHAAAPGSELHRFACGHNDCPRPWPVLRHFFEAQRLLRAAGPAGSLVEAQVEGQVER